MRKLKNLVFHENTLWVIGSILVWSLVFESWWLGFGIGLGVGYSLIKVEEDERELG